MATAMPINTKKVDEATRNLEKCKITAEAEQVPLRHATQVESQILKARHDVSQVRLGRKAINTMSTGPEMTNNRSNI